MTVAPVDPGAGDVAEALAALTAELAQGGYGEAGTFGYTAEQLAARGVHLVGARDAADTLVGVGGIEQQPSGLAELKRFWVAPAARGTGVADAVLDALLALAREHGVHTVRLETGNRQHAAMRFYRRRGFLDVERFAPYVDSPTSVCLARAV